MYGLAVRFPDWAITGSDPGPKTMYGKAVRFLDWFYDTPATAAFLSSGLNNLKRVQIVGFASPAAATAAFRARSQTI